jgi:hypothetical protein
MTALDVVDGARSLAPRCLFLAQMRSTRMSAFAPPFHVVSAGYLVRQFKAGVEAVQNLPAFVLWPIPDIFDGAPVASPRGGITY